MATNIHEWAFFYFSSHFGSFWLILFRFCLYPRGPVPEGEGVRYVSGDIDLPGQGGHKGRPYEGCRWARADTQVCPYDCGGPRRPQWPPLRMACRGQGRHPGLPLRWGFAIVRPLMPWRTSGPRAGTGRVWAWVVAVPALAGGRIWSPRPRGAGPAACAGVRGCLPFP